MRTVGGGVGADTLAALSGFAPSTLHALGVRVLEVFPVVPLVRGPGLSIGMTSYDGRVYVGLNAG